ncbi:cupin domain-containing protein [Mucilaginibacter pocheonensis]|uniref:Quercetin dioxygenase-like cupin family protein n=1 Tax=Mucilaginibacter pocheonensis TaxID=398050 RepID=A0ABU1TEJ5_9SPHI|nr:cupin domain-containing protein [Mucilaginibacter pocheonensis]MDR6943772.1 quercetin dioxygenase-like cupin family protein [Mucilaginibacter pocheonensis]
MKKIVLATMAIVGLLITSTKAQTGHVEATKTPPQVIFTKLLNTPSLKNQEFKMVLVTFQPGEIGAPHRHPIPTFAYVIEGEFESTFNGKTHHYKAGDAFYEEPNLVHGQTKTLGDKPVKLLAIFIGDKGKPFIEPAK